MTPYYSRFLWSAIPNTRIEACDRIFRHIKLIKLSYLRRFGKIRRPSLDFPKSPCWCLRFNSELSASNDWKKLNHAWGRCRKRFLPWRPMTGAFPKRNFMEEIARVITLLILLLQLAVILRMSWRVFREGVSSSFPPGYSSFFILTNSDQISTAKKCAVTSTNT